MSDFEFETIKKEQPELNWTGKRPFKETNFYPAQLKEKYGKEKQGWINKLFWGDNLQVMSHLLKEYRGKINLIYIDPPFDSKADYKKKIEIKNNKKTESNVIEEKQYTDIWTNDEYLQFMYERLIILKELLAEDGSIYVHCDWHKSHHLRLIMDEIFGTNNFKNEIIWSYRTGGSSKTFWSQKHDNILFYTKSNKYTFNIQKEKSYTKCKFRKAGVIDYGKGEAEFFEDENGVYNVVNCRDVWEISYINSQSRERVNYPTQKPEELIERIIQASSNPGDIVFDCFMGSGTTQTVAMKLGRKFIGADINLGSIHTTTKRLINESKNLESNNIYTGFEIYNVNNYELFRNPVEAKELLINSLKIKKIESANVYDGELKGRMIKIMPVNRMATISDLEELKANLPYDKFEKRKKENPRKTVEKITIICMGHESNLKETLKADLSKYKIDIKIMDILEEKPDLKFKRKSDAIIEVENGKVIIKQFKPNNLNQKLKLKGKKAKDWKPLVESIMIDWNYDGKVMKPQEIDMPTKNEVVKGEYTIPKNAKNIKIKITDLLSETYETEITK